MNTVYNTDCLVGMKSFPDKCFDFAICDIPYGINVTKMAFAKVSERNVKQKNGNYLRVKGSNYHLSQWDNEVPGQKYFDELVRISKNQIIFGINYTNWKNVGPGRIIWDKMVPSKLSFSKNEVAYCSFIDHTETIQCLWNGFRQAKSVSEPTIQQGNKKLNEKRIHVCQKPVILYDILIEKYKISGSVIDTHVGSGSIRISCHKKNINFIGYERDKVHFSDQNNRFNEFLNKK